MTLEDYKYRLIADQVRPYVSPEVLEDHISIIREKAADTGLNEFEVAGAHVNQLIQKL